MGKQRIEWADTARGIAIVLVVIFHSTVWTVNAGYAPAWWVEVNEVVETLRMPMFFAVAGLFAGRWMSRSLGDVIRVKVWTLMWVYMVWSAVLLPIVQLEVGLDGMERDPVRNLVGFVLSPVRPRFEMWFLWTLSVFYVVMWLTRRVSVTLQLSVAAALSVVAFAIPAIHEYNVGYSGSLKYYVFFLAGVHLKDRVVAVMGATPRWVAALVVAAWIPLAVAVATFDLQRVPLVETALAGVGVVAGLALSLLVSKAVVLRSLGRQTLPIYVMHTPIVVLVMTALVLLGVPETATMPVGVVMPLAVASLAMVIALAVDRMVAGTPARYLLEPPPFPERLASRAAAIVPARSGGGRPGS